MAMESPWKGREEREEGGTSVMKEVLFSSDTLSVSTLKHLLINSNKHLIASYICIITLQDQHTPDAAAWHRRVPDCPQTFITIL